MSIKREIIGTVLKLTREGPASVELIAKAAKVPLSLVKQQVKHLSKLKLVEARNGTVETNSIQRLRLALEAINSGADIERICRNLSWKEFEEIVLKAFEANGYITMKHFRFRDQAGRLLEIDVLAIKGNIIICVDCKRWMKRLTPSLLDKIVAAQVRRVKVFSRVLPENIGRLGVWLEGNLLLIPVILSLVPAAHKFWNRVPIVPILQLQNFLDELPAHLKSLNILETKL